jgi:two-component system, sensor histidine kinase
VAGKFNGQAFRRWFTGALDASDAAQSRVLREQTDLLIRQSKSGQLNAMLPATLMAVLMAQAVPLWQVLVWLAAIVGGLVLRQRLLQRAQASGSLQAVLRITWWTAALLGFLNTVPGPLLFPHADAVDRSFLTMVHLVWITTAVSVLGVFPPSFRVYSLVGMVNIAAGWLLAADEKLIAWLLTVGMVPMWFVLNGFATRVGRLVEESVNIRHEREALVKKLEVALSETEAAQRARSRFLASASHDLLQPVHALLLFAGLSRDLPEGPKREEVLRQLHGTAESIDGMFRGLLDLARFDAGTLQPQLSAMPVAHVLRAVQAAYQQRCADKGVLLTVELPPGLQIHADPVLFERVLRNLVDNAFKFTQRGEITVRARRDGDTVVIEVQDSGVGISEADLQHVQEAFYRGGSAREVEADGVGLGLANATQMAQLMHGELLLSSVKGQGTTATLSLPASQVRTDGPSAGGALRELRYKVIVLLEDDRTARQATELWLQEHGARVASASDLPGVLAVLEREQLTPDFLLCDYHLGPHMNGTQAVAALRQRFGPLPAAIVSGQELLPAELPPGAPLLSKPLRPEKLLQLLS